MQLSRIMRAIEFGRHIPPGQLLRRLYLTWKRRVLDRDGAGRPLVMREVARPKRIRSLGLHAPHGRVWKEQNSWRARFLGVERELGPSIPWSNTAGDAHDQLWRMNLHYFEYLPDLGDADAAVLIDEWISQCRPLNKAASSAAWMPYAVSLRISAWLEVWSTRGPLGDAAFQRRFASSLAEQADYLAANLETDVRGNHLIKNIRALAEMSTAFNHRASQRWRRLSEKWLVCELPVQVLPDGVHFERSPSYHCQVFADLLSISASRVGSESLGRQLDVALDRMAQATADLVHPDGMIPQFGDSGLHMSVTPAECLRAYAVVRGRAAPAPQPVFAYPHAGLYGARHGQDFVVVKMGRLGPDELMAHAHGDWGSFEWSVGGHRVVVDQGVFEYVDGDRRIRSRSTASHNTVMLDSAEQADFFSAFRCGSRPRSVRVNHSVKASGFVLEGELGPSCHKSNGRHVRRIDVEGSRLTIEDRASEGGILSSKVLLHPLVQLHSVNDAISLDLQSGERVKVRANGGERPVAEPAEWWPDMGQTISTSRVVATSREDSFVRLTFECLGTGDGSA